MDKVAGGFAQDFFKVFAKFKWVDLGRCGGFALF